MLLTHWATSVLGSRELWAAVAGSLLAAAVRQLVVRTGAVPRGAGVPMVLVAGLAAGTAAGAGKWGVPLVALVAATVVRDGARPEAPDMHGAVLSCVAAGALYACLPDTEVALAVLGAVVATAALSVLLRLPWQAAAWTTTSALLAATLADGRPRTTALLGGTAIAVVHALASARGRQPDVQARVLVGVSAAMIVCSRVAGRGALTAWSVVLAAGCVVAIGALILGSRDSASGPRQRVRPPPSDD